MRIISGCFRSVFNRVSTLSAQLAFCKALGAEARVRNSETRHAARAARKPSSERSARRVASYARFSSELQRDTSIGDQQRSCREAAAQLGLEIDPALEFADHAISGTTTSRNGLDDMVARAERREFDVLFLHGLSRLSRETTHILPLLKTLVVLHGVRLISLTDGIDSFRVDWYDTAVHTSVSDEKFLRVLSANVHRGQSGNVLDGYSAGDTRFGYTSIPCPKGTMVGRGRYAVPRNVYAVVEAERLWVRTIFTWFVTEQRSLSWIVKELNRQRVPKGGRSKKTHWYVDLVRNLLRSEKYVGIWPWGRTRVVRNPLTGKVEKVYRSENECAKWTRVRLDLQIIEDEVFEAAQRQLDAQSESLRIHRDRKGRLSGRPKGATHKHLLSGLLRCSECGSALGCYDESRVYLVCPGRIRGFCSLATRARRKLAEERIVAAVQEALLRNQSMLDAVVNATTCAWRAAASSRPDVLSALERTASDLRKKISNLIDLVENGDPDHEVRSRLATRRKELQEVEKQIEGVNSAPRLCEEEPTREWISEQLNSLVSVLTAESPATWKAFQELVDGPLIVESDRSPQTRQPFLKTVLRLSSKRISGLLIGSEPAAETAEVIIEVPLEFRRPLLTEGQAVEAHRLWHEGASNQDIAARLGVSEGRVSAIFHYAEDHLGMAYPECRARPRTDTLYTRLEPEVVELYRANMLYQTIADELNTTRQTVRQILIRWHHRQGLEMPDGRSRRKNL